MNRFRHASAPKRRRMKNLFAPDRRVSAPGPAWARLTVVSATAAFAATMSIVHGNAHGCALFFWVLVPVVGGVCFFVSGGVASGLVALIGSELLVRLGTGGLVEHTLAVAALDGLLLPAAGGFAGFAARHLSRRRRLYDLCRQALREKEELFQHMLDLDPIHPPNGRTDRPVVCVFCGRVRLADRFFVALRDPEVVHNLDTRRSICPECLAERYPHLPESELDL